MKVGLGDLVALRKEPKPECKNNLGIVFNFPKVNVKDEICLHLNDEEIFELLNCLSLEKVEELDSLSGIEILWSSGEITTSYIEELQIIQKNKNS